MALVTKHHSLLFTTNIFQGTAPPKRVGLIKINIERTAPPVSTIRLTGRLEGKFNLSALASFHRTLSQSEIRAKIT